MDAVIASQSVEAQEPVAVFREHRQDAEQRLSEVPEAERALVAQRVAGARKQDLDLAEENGVLGQLTTLVLKSALKRRDHRPSWLPTLRARRLSPWQQP